MLFSLSLVQQFSDQFRLSGDYVGYFSCLEAMSGFVLEPDGTVRLNFVYDRSCSSKEAFRSPASVTVTLLDGENRPLALSAGDVKKVKLVMSSILQWDAVEWKRVLTNAQEDQIKSLLATCKLASIKQLLRIKSDFFWESLAQVRIL